MFAVVVSDTHAPRHWRGMPPGVLDDLARADLILHAGDVCEPDVLDEFARYAPTLAVLGNNDGAEVAAWPAPATREFELDGIPVGMVHDSGARAGRDRRMRALFPSARLVVFGHSHLPWDTDVDGLRLFNPGSLTDPRRHPWPSYGVIETDRGVIRTRIVPLPRPVPRR